MKRNYASVEVYDFIIQNVDKNPGSITRIVSQEFGISRQAVNRHLHKLVRDGVLVPQGNTRNRRYALKPIMEKVFTMAITHELEEDMVWRQHLKPLFTVIKPNVVDICHYGFTEMFNNVLVHSEGKSAVVGLKHMPGEITMTVMDDGIGIFNKITRDLGLEDNRHAVLELSKGKLTTDPEQHTGEGIFFTTRMFDKFWILSGGLYFFHSEGQQEDWLLEDREDKCEGTSVTMSIGTKSSRTTKQVFDKYAAKGDDYAFTRTHVPVALAKYGEENLVSRSQAKRLLARLEPFREVFLNFEGVEFIGQAFADEIFRVFKNNNPHIDLIWVRANDSVEKMIRRVISGSSGSQTTS